LIRDLLVRLEQTPSLIVSRSQLDAIGGDAGFRELRKRQVIRWQSTATSGVVARGGRRLLLLDEPGGPVRRAIDMDEPEEDPVAIAPSDLERWEVNLPAVADLFRARNQLCSRYSSLDARLHFLGALPGGAAVVLALIDSETRGVQLLPALRGLLPSAYAELQVWCPTYEPAPTLARLLEASGVRCHLLDSGDPLLLRDDVRATLYRFRRTGTTWDVTFNGATFSVAHSKGLEYLSLLLAKPNEWIAAAELAGSRVVESATPLLDQQAQQQIKGRARALKSEVEEAQALGDDARRERARAELEQIADQLQRDTGRAGRSRTFGGAAERARQNVGRAVGRAIDAIAAGNAAAGEHFRQQVDTGGSCRYRPVPGTEWNR